MHKLKIYFKSKKKPIIISSKSERAIESASKELFEKLTSENSIIEFKMLIFDRSDFSHMLKT